MEEEQSEAKQETEPKQLRWKIIACGLSPEIVFVDDDDESCARPPRPIQIEVMSGNMPPQVKQWLSGMVAEALKHSGIGR